MPTASPAKVNSTQRRPLTLLWQRRFSKLLVAATLFLIFVGGLVKSTESGLAVPDWPLSYGTWFPPMVGGVFYEHGHRMVAAVIGLMTLLLAFSLQFSKQPRWIKGLGWLALGAVIVQGVLGGITVLLYLPATVSVAHGTLAQTFFLLTIMIAYSLSRERHVRQIKIEQYPKSFIQCTVIFLVLVYAQLIIGAIMRHTESGLAIYDFPTMAGEWIPSFGHVMLSRINDWRFEHNFDPVTMGQVLVHAIHRFWVILILVCLIVLNRIGMKRCSSNDSLFMTVMCINLAVFVQIILGISTVLTKKEVYTTTFHVTMGAVVLGLAMLLLLRALPVNIREWKKIV